MEAAFLNNFVGLGATFLHTACVEEVFLTVCLFVQGQLFFRFCLCLGLFVSFNTRPYEGGRISSDNIDDNSSTWLIRRVYNSSAGLGARHILLYYRVTPLHFYYTTIFHTWVLFI